MDVIEYGSKTARAVLLQPVDEHDFASLESEISAIRKIFPGDFQLTAIRISDWNRDLSPWKAPAVYGREAFGGRAADTLSEILRYCADDTREYYIGGYSLAGLFALWAACRTALFRGVAAASPSVWFPGFPDYLKTHEMLSPRVYLSLGDREEKTRNPVMAAVGDHIRGVCSLLKSRGTDCFLEWNEGNHFRDADLRTAKAFAWVLNSSGQNATPPRLR